MDNTDYYYQGFYYLENYEMQKAVDAFQKSLHLKKTWEAYQGLGWALLKIDQYKKTVNHLRYKAAINAFKKSLDLEKNWQTYQGLAYAFLRIEQYQLSIDASKKSLTLTDE